MICSLPESLQENMTITEHSKPPIPDTGAGRKLSLETSLTVQEVVDRTKAHLGMSHLRLALANSHSMDSKVGKRKLSKRPMMKPWTDFIGCDIVKSYERK